jgi:histidinol-phosphatase
MTEPGAESPPHGAAWSATLRRGAEAELRSWIDAALTWCGDADAVAMDHFRGRPTTTRKPDRSFVTEADTAIERLLRERIADAYPGHGIVGEEYGTEAGGASVRWIVDPIDATHNYLRGVPVFATLIAVERDGEVQAGVISAPALGTRWYAWRGGGAWAAGSGLGTAAAGSATDRQAGGRPRPLAVTGISDLAEAQVITSASRDLRADGRAPGTDALLAAAWRERGFGDFWGYALLAEGAAEAMIEVGLKIWDIAAPAVIVEEAGGRVTDFEGRRILDGGTTLATNGVLHDRIRSVLTGAERGEGALTG